MHREILKSHPEVSNVNAVLIDFLLYDLAKERETSSKSSTLRLRVVSIAKFVLASVGCLVQFKPSMCETFQSIFSIATFELSIDSQEIVLSGAPPVLVRQTSKLKPLTARAI